MSSPRIALIGADPLRLAATDLPIIPIARDLSNLARITEAALVVEALSEQPEHLPVKEAVLQELDAVAPITTIIATQRGPWLLTDLAAPLQHPERLIGFHSPVPHSPLVELLGHGASDPLRIERLWTWLQTRSYVPLAVADAPGGLVHRVAVPYFNEAARLVAEGYDLPTVEAAAQAAFGTATGPFAVMNAWGLPYVRRLAETLGTALGAFYGLAAPIEAQGDTPWHLEPGKPREEPAITARLWGVILHVALEMVSEHVTSPRDLDTGLCAALGWQLGPFAEIQARGPVHTARLAAATQARYRLWAPAAQETMVHRVHLD